MTGDIYSRKILRFSHIHSALIAFGYESQPYCVYHILTVNAAIPAVRHIEFIIHSPEHIALIHDPVRINTGNLTGENLLGNSVMII